MSKPILTCYGGVGAVTGANFLLETGAKKILVDCGLLQGLPTAERVNAEPFDYDVASIDHLFVTHAHIDHVGKIPKLVKDGFKGAIYSTEETKELAALMLLDMAKIGASQARAEGKTVLYGPEDVEAAMGKWQALEYHQPKDLGDCSVELLVAGHILGSAMYKFTFASGKSILFSGDTGSEYAPIEEPIDSIAGQTYLLIDSVYGDRNHESPEERDKKLREAVIEAATHNRTLLIPAFSLERTQVLLYELHKIFAQGLAPKIPVFLDSPLAIRVTELYERFKKDFNPEVEKEVSNGTDVFSFPKLTETLDFRDSKEIDKHAGGKIIMAGSGMSTAGRILSHESRFLPDESATVLMVGYQAPGTLGRLIQSGAKEVVIDGAQVPVRAKVVTVDGFSAHRDSNGLVELVAETAKTVKRVFVVMGEPKSSAFLAQRLHDELGLDAMCPERAKPYELDL